MTLFIGCHMVKLGQDGQPCMNPAGEVHVEYEITELGSAQTPYDHEGKPLAEPDRVFAILKKVR
ncbi:MAG TPA: hypothetical protein VK667_07760 [Ktedonobacteraceae bacterium]|nr:hypothetical protein [Ktedonobacteraceae bacterium]